MTTQPGVKFLYLFGNDLAAMRHFNSDLLGLNEIYYVAGSDGGLGYDCDGLQFTIFLDETVTPYQSGWARQPGWVGGDRPVMSWSIPYSADEFRLVLKRLHGAKVPTRHLKPQWVSYWSFPVKDPMGNTVEIVLSVENEPASKAWV